MNKYFRALAASLCFAACAATGIGYLINSLVVVTNWPRLRFTLDPPK